MTVYTTLKNALADPLLPITSDDNKARLEAMLSCLNTSDYMSVWTHEIGQSRMEYHHHDAIRGAELAALHRAGVRGGNPRLIGVYSRDELEELVKREADSYKRKIPG